MSDNVHDYGKLDSTWPSFNIATAASANGLTIGAATVQSGSITADYRTGWHDSRGLQVSGPANFDGNVTFKGVDIVKLLESIQDRLAILVPDPEKLEKYQALKKAYDHYKLLETLVKEN